MEREKHYSWIDWIRHCICLYSLLERWQQIFVIIFAMLTVRRKKTIDYLLAFSGS